MQSLVAVSCSKVYSRALSVHTKDRQNLFSFTKGRWLYNNEKQITSRHVPFNVSALVDAAVEAAGAHSCMSFEKLDEGLFNRVFVLRLDNDEELIARIPFHLAGPKHFTTASEVATMDYALTELQLPVPRVRAWSSHAERTLVGTEYIIYDKVPGVELQKRWWDPDVKGTLAMDLITTIVAFERVFIDKRFSQIGSLYFKEDLPLSLQTSSLYAVEAPTPNSERFRIGPSLNREFWRGERAALNVDRGPWSDAHLYARALSACERAWLTHSDTHPSEEHLFLLDDFDKLVPFLIPSVPAFILWHPDMHEANIIATESDPCKITGIIDWQSTVIGPYFMQVSPFPLLEYTPSPYIDYTPWDRKPPKRTPGYDMLNAEQKQKADLAYKAAFRSHAYELKMRELNPTMMDIVQQATAREIALRPLRAITRGRTEGLAAIRDTLIDVCDYWGHLVGLDADGVPTVPCPVRYTDAERARHKVEYEGLLKACRLRETLYQQLGLEADGFVTSERYDAVKDMSDKEMQKSLDVAQTEEERVWIQQHWPIQDGQLSYSAETCQ
ncbi:Altered inheritance of mitochondria protein 9, mitochondrial [Hypsizygus marmoreus]|uniref:Altered inheritance of mitochondria protein 9, mitochondrial n=1 Tax=Hypsizygus marmoreus TaxID=39966 RepID=A0A369JM42_HYPMA|nr:Altered inheritance of mitochondria protein 9, mitochondrial [Hypsizygus marmoreus]